MPFLQHFVDSDEGFEGLDLVGEDGLDLHTCPEGLGGLVVPCIDNAASDMFSLGGSLVGVGGLLDVDGKLGFGSAARGSG